MKDWSHWRFARLAFFLGVVLVLGRYFWIYEKPKLAPAIQQHLSWLSTSGELSNVTPWHISPEEILNLENELRAEASVPKLSPDPVLTAYAQQIVNLLSQNSDHLEDEKELDSVLNQVIPADQTGYQQIATLTVVGPTSSEQTLSQWQKEPQRQTLLDADLTRSGIATASTQVDSFEVGIIVQLLAQPQPTTTPNSKPSSSKVTSPSVSNVPDGEVMSALNAYRQTHNVPALLTDQRLCEYAETRVQDLIAFGGLDHHQGFSADFADNQRPPELKDYPGSGFAENLASQFCLNGTSGEPFIANTGTALIEWCFDSSQKGHREAQLNPRYNAGCVRHGQNMYVVIFGE